MNKPSFIFVIGGVISGVGKGITASSIGKILQDKGVKVTAIKIDPYVNIDAGTMNPTEHGEVFVLNDGYETDQDMGNYERFLNLDLTSENYMTTGKVYQSVISKERSLKYKGSCVQVVPHIPLEIVEQIESAQKKENADVVIIEIGGTIGEYENILFLEAARMMKSKNPKKVCFVMVSYLPTPVSVGEMKTKPTQHSVRTLNGSGIQPDIIIARSSEIIDEKRREKLSFFCNIPKEHIISAPDIKNIYDVPANFEKANLSSILAKMLDINLSKKISSNEKKWKKMTEVVKKSKNKLKIAIVGKYFDSGDFVISDVYISIIEAIKFSSYFLGYIPELTWFSAQDFEKDPSKIKILSKYNGVVIPGGFGSRGTEGKIKAIEYIRKNKIPFLGLCYGMQLAVIEYARNKANIKNATSREIDSKSKYCVIDLIGEQKENIKKEHFGGSMRLGSYSAKLKENTLAKSLYKKNLISERHRHRFEVNPIFINDLENSGLVFSASSLDGKLMEIIELSKDTHPFFIATQFHPEFQARPLNPHPLFNGFISACIKNKK